MKTVIVEDEFIAAQALERLIREVDKEIQVVAVLQSVEESIEWFSQNSAPDFVFMDIHLGDGSSFSIFDKTNITCPIIFTTAYDEYALKSFELNSIDYLLKPINKKDLERAIGKFRNFTSKNDNADMVANILATLQQTKDIYKSHFLIPYKDKLQPLAVDRIAFLYSEFKIAKITTFDGQTFTMDYSLDELSRQLDPSLFFRVNRQYIIAHKAIKDISIWFGGKLSVNLYVSTPEKIIVSRARVPGFKEWYTK
ncbi:LytTR family DNA-binding domain-containing protein [uncultured Bacteroides sp.]|uniref:LytR/AlgR family response regulator transcription factor n=1 Tax=uncultured Bacteroides sp. TaxID=162156 RepID=UPI002AA8B2FA|nr:LytTR family DNA-binding domain-containing protein [uncultured Bacteroides sp.]